MISQPNAIESAVAWIDGIFTGRVSLGIATIAVAAFGFLLLSGRVEARRGIQTIVGCFILFGASAIAAGIVSSVHGSNGATDATAGPDIAPLLIEPNQVQPAAPDPYAGAAVPRQR